MAVPANLLIFNNNINNNNSELQNRLEFSWHLYIAIVRNILNFFLKNAFYCIRKGLNVINKYKLVFFYDDILL